MKYKRQLATGALAVSLLVGGSTIFAATPQDLGIKNGQAIYQKQNKSNKNIRRYSVVGIISTLNDTGFILEVKNKKTKGDSSIDVGINSETVFKKNGLPATKTDLAVGQKTIISGNLDEITNLITARTVKIV
jgi:hypothetical protein